MTGARFAPAVETVLTLGLGLVAIHLALAPLSYAVDGGVIAPDLVFALVCAWVLRRPAAAPLWAVLALGLGADLLLDRPLGLGALGLLVAAEVLRGNAGVLRSGPFLMEWLAVAALALAWAVGAHVALKLVFLDGPGLGPLLREALATALAYPLVVLALAFGLGMRSRRAGAPPGRTGRLS